MHFAATEEANLTAVVFPRALRTPLCPLYLIAFVACVCVITCVWMHVCAAGVCLGGGPELTDFARLPSQLEPGNPVTSASAGITGNCQVCQLLT